MTATQPIASDQPTNMIPRYWPQPYSPRGKATPVIAGTTIAGGRIRLLICYGESPHLQFWQAVDTMTGQHLAITVVNSENALPSATIDTILSETASLQGIDSPGLARVIDVGRDQCGGVIVAEWTRGATLKEVADTGPSPIGVADAVLSLAEAADLVHGAGLALSIDHPDRIRISVDGRVVLAFPATMPNTMPQQDLRGIGAIMYALLVNQWPLGDGTGTRNWNGVTRDADGRVREPAVVNPQIPFLISSTAAGLVRDGDGIRSARTVLTLLREGRDEGKNGTSPSTTQELLLPPMPGRYAGFRNFGPVERAQHARRQLLKTCLGTAAIVGLVLLLSFATTISEIVGALGSDGTMNAGKLGLQSTTPSPAAPGEQPPAHTAGRVTPLNASVFSPGGAPDSPNTAGLAIDGNHATAWSTDTYVDAQPFPKFKDGVGLLLQLPSPTSLSEVTVDLNSTGTVAQIRSSTSATPAKLGDTGELSPPTPLQPGHNVIAVANAAPTTFVLVWISTLGTTSGRSHTDVSEITLQSTGTLR